VNTTDVVAERPRLVSVPAEPEAVSARELRNRLLWGGLIALFVLALSIRFYHLASHHWVGYEHDAASHSAYVGYIKLHHRLPPVDDDTEFPQQPLYYVLASPFYNAALNFDENQWNLAPYGFCVSAASLSLAFFSLRYLSAWILRYGFFIYMGFTPSFVLASGCVGNDVMSGFFGTLYFFCLLRFNRNPRAARFFVLAVVAIFGALLTKLNGVVLLAGLPWFLWRSAGFDLSPKATVARITVLVSLLALWAGAISYRAWSVANQQFVFVHAWMWDYMAIKENMLVYALRFDLAPLIQAGQTTTVDSTPEIVRYSFPTWEYGNMLLGEYDYSHDPILLFCSRQLIVAGTCLLFGLVLFVLITLISRPFRSWATIFSLNRTALLLIVGSSCMVLTFVSSTPVACNADFRYQSVVFPWIGYGIARGLCAFPRSSFWRNWMTGLLGFFLYAALCFLITLYIRR